MWAAAAPLRLDRSGLPAPAPVLLLLEPISFDAVVGIGLVVGWSCVLGRPKQ
jgi:hypothetical protein